MNLRVKSSCDEAVEACVEGKAPQSGLDSRQPCLLFHSVQSTQSEWQRIQPQSTIIFSIPSSYAGDYTEGERIHFVFINFYLFILPIDLCLFLIQFNKKARSTCIIDLTMLV